MIDQVIFAQGFALLCERFNTQNKAAVAEIYYAILSQRLDNTQFERAVFASFAYDQFFPGPADLIHKIFPSPEERAIAAWQEILQADPNSAWDWSDSLGWECVKLVGGLRHIHNCPVDKLDFLRSAFISAYKQGANRQEQLTLAEGLTGLAGLNKANW